jgi:hypothetical protein
MVVHDGAMVLETALNILFRSGNPSEEIFEQKHIERLSENGARDLRPSIGDEIGMDDKNAEETTGAVVADAAFKKLV